MVSTESKGERLGEGCEEHSDYQSVTPARGHGRPKCNPTWLLLRTVLYPPSPPHYRLVTDEGTREDPRMDWVS